jgi:hypothetical protein
MCNWQAGILPRTEKDTVSICEKVDMINYNSKAY